jgi:hypothetical protein
MKNSTTLNPLKIAIVDGGWVFIGRAEQVEGGIKMADTSCIRQWGTTKGIGQLALSGPQKETVLDPAGIIFIPNHALLTMIEVVQQKWSKYEI